MAKIYGVKPDIFKCAHGLGVFNNLDGRRVEVVSDGLTLWLGAQLAIHRDGSQSQSR